jgi:uncharacterized membrane protein
VNGRRAGLVGAALAAVGLAVSIYLTSVKLAGALPVCGPLKGCEDVALSPYSEIMGIPVALFGAGFSALVLLLTLTWWRAGDRRALLASYGLGLFGILFVVYLTYLELFVIHAVCVWCVAYALTVFVGWIVAAVAVRQSGEGPG